MIGIIYMSFDNSIKIGSLVFIKKNLDDFVVYNIDKTEYKAEMERSK